MPIDERHIPTVLRQWRLAASGDRRAEREYESGLRIRRLSTGSPTERRRVEEHRRLWRRVRRRARLRAGGGTGKVDIRKLIKDDFKNDNDCDE